MAAAAVDSADMLQQHLEIRVAVDKVDFGGVLNQASLAYVPEAQVGDYVIVHAGFAISRLDEEEAGKVFEYLRQIEELGDLNNSGGAA